MNENYSTPHMTRNMNHQEQVEASRLGKLAADAAWNGVDPDYEDWVTVWNDAYNDAWRKYADALTD